MNMSVSNYNIMRDQMRGEFIKYDQEKMMQKYGLDYDDNYIYIDFAWHRYRIGRTNGIVEWSEDAFFTAVEADYNESMTIYDVLCYAKEDSHLSGYFCPVNMLKGVVHSSGLGGSLFQKTADEFDKKTEELRSVCLRYGDKLSMKGDVAARLMVFPFLPVILQYWAADDEFPANLKFMFDENILQYMHYETIYFMMGHIIRRLKELMESKD